MLWNVGDVCDCWVVGGVCLIDSICVEYLEVVIRNWCCNNCWSC